MAVASRASLKTYKSKRDFTKTAEPAGKVGRRKAKQLTFVVQKHDATRLHYDFRLELDGVLLSWAVTKGPSTNPADKRLAVHVEDHPLDYGAFEGTIPEGEYGGGTVMLWDEGTWEPVGDPHEGLAKGDLKFILHGKRMKGSWVLVHMKGRDVTKRDGTVRENWLLIKHDDEYATRTDGLTDRFTTSVETGRDLAGIAKGNKPKRKSASGLVAPAVRPSVNGPKAAKKDTTPRRKGTSTVTLTDEMGIAAAEQAGVKLTHPDKVVYAPDVTKARLVAYYAAIAPRMLPHVMRRPVSLVRLPTGSKKPFFQKHDSGGFPDAFKKVQIKDTTGPTDIYLYIEDVGGLIGGVQMSTQEFHIWGSHIETIEQADRIIFDIDPDEGLDFATTRQAASDIRDKLEDLGLKAYPMVTGGKGIHVIAPLQPGPEWPDIKAFCKGFADTLAADEPDRFTSNIRKVKRTGRMFVDYLRNERGQTAVCPFSTRAKSGLSCAVPVSWDELNTLPAANVFSLEEAAAHAKGPDPWPDYFQQKQAITKTMIKAVGAG